MGGPGGMLGGRMLGGGVLHGEVVVKKADGSGTETLLVQSGTVTAKTSSSVTVKSSDGFTVTWSVGSSTMIRGGKALQPPAAGAQPTKPANGTLADIAANSEVTVLGTTTSAGGDARMIGARPAGAPQGWGDHRRGGTGPNGTTPKGSTPKGSTPAPSGSATTQQSGYTA
jgi:hypothetical protein